MSLTWVALMERQWMGLTALRSLFERRHLSSDQLTSVCDTEVQQCTRTLDLATGIAQNGDSLIEGLREAKQSITPSDVMKDLYRLKQLLDYTSQHAEDLKRRIEKVQERVYSLFLDDTRPGQSPTEQGPS